jgi:hypothetical protein
VIDGGHMPKRIRARQALLPDDAHVAAQRQALPNFDPYDTRQLLTDAEAFAKMAGSTGKKMSLDEAVVQAHKRLQARQIRELTQAMSLDPRSPNCWHDAFVRLAEIDHNVGRLIHRWTPSKKNNIKSSLSKMSKQVSLVEEVDVRSGSNSKRETFRHLAKVRSVGGASSNKNSSDDRARTAAKQQAYYRAKREIASAKETGVNLQTEPLANPAGLLSYSEFETLLFNIENRPKRGGDN